MKDDIQHAYALLGLPAGASHGELKRQHRKLVKKWHPDRFASDPAAQAVAGDQLARINAAYRLLVESGTGSVETQAAPAARSAPSTPSTFTHHGRMSREEIDRIVAAINARSDGTIDGWRDWLDQRIESARPFAADRRVRLAAVLLLLSAVAAEIAFLLGGTKQDLGGCALALIGLARIWLWLRPERGKRQ